MSWTKFDFLSILNSKIAKQLFASDTIQNYVKNFSLENKAALLHANSIQPDTIYQEAAKKLELVAAFARKDVRQINQLVNVDKVSVGCRLDYMIPLYDQNYDGGEDIFVVTLKMMLGNSFRNDNGSQPILSHSAIQQLINKNYAVVELLNLSNYIKDSIYIRELLRDAPNKSVIEPNPFALDYLIMNARNYTDSNHNPVMVFLPGIIAVSKRSLSDMILAAFKNGAEINAAGFLGVTGLIWAIILGDVNVVAQYLQLGANPNLDDDFNNKDVRPWIECTRLATEDNELYQHRLAAIEKLIKEAGPVLRKVNKN